MGRLLLLMIVLFQVRVVMERRSERELGTAMNTNTAIHSRTSWNTSASEDGSVPVSVIIDVIAVAGAGRDVSVS